MSIIHVEPNTFERSKSGSVSGRIFLRLDDECFPERDWSDFPVVLLGWWIAGLLTLMDKRNSSVECLFMDGPFAFRLSRLTSDLLEVTVGRRDGESRKMGTIVMVDLAISLQIAAEQTLESCRSRGWTSRDIETLQEQADAMRKLRS